MFKRLTAFACTFSLVLCCLSACKHSTPSDEAALAAPNAPEANTPAPPSSEPQQAAPEDESAEQDQLGFGEIYKQFGATHGEPLLFWDSFESETIRATLFGVSYKTAQAHNLASSKSGSKGNNTAILAVQFRPESDKTIRFFNVGNYYDKDALGKPQDVMYVFTKNQADMTIGSDPRTLMLELMEVSHITNEKWGGASACVKSQVVVNAEHDNKPIMVWRAPSDLLLTDDTIDEYTPGKAIQKCIDDIPIEPIDNVKYTETYTEWISQYRK